MPSSRLPYLETHEGREDYAWMEGEQREGEEQKQHKCQASPNMQLRCDFWVMSSTQS